MVQRRSPHRVSFPPNSNNLARRQYSLRHTSAAKRALAFVNRFQRSSANSHTVGASPPSSSDTTVDSRPILATLQPNLRRLPSRQYLLMKNSIRDVSQNLDVPIGSKRKRVASLNENMSGCRPARGAPKLKKLKASSIRDSSSEEPSDMEVDVPGRWNVSDASEIDYDEEASDEFLINEASLGQLKRRRKDELLQLYTAAGLSDDAHNLTKLELAEAIIAARDDIVSLPPSSPGRDASDCSSDEGNAAGGEETDAGTRYRVPPGLRRRATVHLATNQANSRFLKTRSLSVGHINASHSCPDELPVACKTNGTAALTRRTTRSTSSRSSPTPSSSNQLPSPPATRLRARKVSAEVVVPRASTRSKGKGKQVEFSEDVKIAESAALGEESELTDLTELDEKIASGSPSPRRLRSREKRGGVSDDQESDTPKQRGRARRQTSRGEEVENTLEDEEEVDELISSPSPTPPPMRCRATPAKRRLRSRRLQTHTPPSDGGEGDDEEEADEEQVEEGVEEDGSSMDDEQSEQSEDSRDVDGDDDVYVEESTSPPPTTTPRKLRNGKVVGEECQEDTPDEDEEQDGNESVDLEAEDIDIDAEEEAEEIEEIDEAIDGDDFDLAVATKKTLLRMRRDNLVRMCETRDLDVAGTKPQLARSLLQWRDQRTSEFSSPSSTGTIRPPSTAHHRANGRRKAKSRSQSNTPPVLLRSHRIHQDEPRTPLSGENTSQPEPELELDLESLGLEDREIPPDKLTKLEKIGSGGFKDVFIGKFKGRRVAIAEFRDQLNSMDIKELKLLGGFDHPNIVRFLGVSIPENTRETPVMIVSELCSNGDLFDYIRNVPAPSLKKVLSIMLDVARGMEYLHMRKPSVIHRDCKSSNILITSRGTAKIADFGLAKVKQSTRSMVRSLVGTVNWQAPELWHAHPKYNHKVDVFSCAMVYWEMFQWHVPNKKFPWEGMNEHAIYDIVGTKRQRPSITGLRKQWCPDIIDLLERMWAHDPNDRPTMSEVVKELERIAV
ncbi:uncharacterized protein F5147DRAFT_673515 [Suillus discolor]|uniref:Protein kinase domain-containing protein n=1 Tax=Suillus discolor TaxID=1912936 RepID=A0A9P7FGR1_9AGAM|nr:uncharacterized protein F5147DRAFT_673515 [Suillus discolor]KAG2116579.1 hypothetical protein F5147DRAFT_673515 [Suillus discolor]